MRRHIFRALVAFAIAAVSVTPAVVAPRQVSPDLIAHEWGTFTSVAGQDGRAVPWTPLSGPSDLPCFVYRLSDGPKIIGPSGTLAAMKTTVRMETPVVYFYSPRRQRVDLSVFFPNGLITEWYPRAAITPSVAPFSVEGVTGAARWGLDVAPAAPGVFPTEADPSHYYPARETDAAPVVVGQETEKFLFYRGVASFPVPVQVVASGTRITATTADARPAGTVVLFHNRGGKIGYRVVEAGASARIEEPVLDATLTSLTRDLHGLLTSRGLYPREADAMIATWRDSWFEPGTRLFYFMSKDAADRVLPLAMTPAPAELVRVFVGRVEVFTESTLRDVESAFLANDIPRLMRYGRFLQPMTARLVTRPAIAPIVDRLHETLAMMSKAAVSERACQ